jgi:hypothetical protein
LENQEARRERLGQTERTKATRRMVRAEEKRVEISEDWLYEMLELISAMKT